MADRNGYIGRAPGDSAVIIARQNYSPTGIQTDFTFNSGYTPGYVDVYINGVRLIDVQDYVASTGNTVGLTSYANSGDIVEVIAYKAFNVGNVENATGNFDVGGNLTVSGDTNVSGQTTTKNLHVTGVSTLSGASYLADVTEFVSSGIVTVSNTTDSTSSTTGALLVNGGVGVALSMHVGGNLSVGGTLTYEDVTNVDAIGIVTAQSGVNIVGGGLTCVGVATFFGNLTVGDTLYLVDQVVHTGDTNTKIRFPANDTFSVETAGSERLRIASDGKVGIATDDPQTSLHVLGGQNGFRLERDAANPGYLDIAITSGTPVGANNHGSAYFTLSNTAGDYVWKSSTNERMRLLGDSGYLGIGTDNPSVPLHVLSSSTGLRIQRGTQSLTVNANYGGASHCALEFTGALSLFPGGGSEKIRITSAGNIGIGSVVPTGKVDIATGGNAYINLGQDSDNPKVVMFRSTGNASNTHYGAELQFLTGDFAFSNAAAADLGSHSFTERFRIDSAGRLLVGHTSSNDSANFAPVFQIEGTDSVDSSMSLIRNGANAHPPYLTFGKSRGTSNGADTIVQDSDTLGSIDFWGADGSTAWAQASKITASIDGTPGSNVTPGKLRFWTTPASSGTSQERLTIDSSGRVLIGTATSKSAGSGQYAKLNVEGGVSTTENFTSFSRAEAASAMSANDEVANLTFNDSAGYEFARIQVLCDAAPGATDTPGRIVFKTTADGASSSTNRLTIDKDGDVMMGNLAYNEGNALNVVSNTYDGIGVYRHSNNASTPLIALGKSRGSTGGSTTVVQNDDYLGRIAFKGADGDELHVGAAIDCQVDTTPGNNDMPARLVFSTVPNGTTTLTERLRIGSTGALTVNSGNAHTHATLVLSKADAGAAKLEFDVGTSQKAYVELDASEDLVHYGAANVAQYFYAGGNERLRITSAGNVLISGTFQINNFQIWDAGWTSSWDTGISVNQSNAGGCLIFMNCSNWDANDSTAAGIYIVRLGYSGGQDPQVWHISGNNSWTISRNTSTDTVKITNASGNQRTAILWTT